MASTSTQTPLDFSVGRELGHSVAEALIGGRQLSGLARWTSGFPIGVSNGAQWPTNWELSGFATQTGPVSTGLSKKSDGTVSLFADPTTALNNFQADLPGEVGNRNVLRGQGFAGLDLGLSKRWKIRERNSLQFRWDVFNALNLTRFDVQSLSLSLTNTSSFGRAPDKSSRDAIPIAFRILAELVLISILAAGEHHSPAVFFLSMSPITLPLTAYSTIPR
jgi:hypothetical protein